MENFLMLYVHFKELPLISTRSKHSKRRTQIQTNQNGKPNPTTGTTMYNT